MSVAPARSNFHLEAVDHDAVTAVGEMQLSRSEATRYIKAFCIIFYEWHKSANTLRDTLPVEPRPGDFVQAQPLKSMTMRKSDLRMRDL